MADKRLTWLEIKERYPHQYVGLTDIEYGDNKASVKSAIVAYEDSTSSYGTILELYLKGEVLMRYTTLDEDAAEVML